MKKEICLHTCRERLDNQYVFYLKSVNIVNVL